MNRRGLKNLYLAACAVLVTALAGPVLAKFADRIPTAFTGLRRSRVDEPVSAH